MSFKTSQLCLAGILTVILLTVPGAFALTLKWDQNYGGINLDEAYAIAGTPDSGYVLTGFTSSAGAGGNDLLLMRIDRDGNLEWSQTYGGADSDWGFDVELTADSHLIVVGFSSSFSTSPQAYLLKTDLDGTVEWGRVFGGPAAEYAYDVALAHDGGFIVVGETYSFGAGLSDVYIIKVSDSGILEWTKFYGGSATDWGEAVVPTADGGYVITGFTSSFGAGNYDVYLLKIDVDGDSLWAQTYGGSAFDGGRAVVETESGELIVGGVTYRTSVKGNDAYLLGLDSEGTLLWETVVGGGGDEIMNRLFPLQESSLIAVGKTSSEGSGAEDFFLLKLDNFGDSLASATYGAAANEEARTAAGLDDVGMLVAGYSRSFGDQSQVYVTRVDHDFVCGDVDGTGTVAVSDIVALIQYIFADGSPPFPLMAGNADCSATVNIGDAVFLVDYVFSDGAAPCPDCGVGD
jgi:hypothetical protein